MFEKVMAPFVAAWEHLKEVGGFGDPSGLSIEDFRLELAELGLLGKAFGPEEYRAVLEERLGIEIAVEELSDAEGGELAGQLAAEGVLAQAVVDEETGNAVVLARESLRYAPWPAYELSIFHELSHLAAGHPLRVKRARANGVGNKLRSLGGRLARKNPPELSDSDEGEEEIMEAEARKRAKWLVLAGTCPEAFESESVNRLT